MTRISTRLLDTKELVILGHALRTSRSASLDLASAERDDEVGDESVLGLTGAVGDHDTPTVTLAELSAMRVRCFRCVEFGIEWKGSRTLEWTR